MFTDQPVTPTRVETLIDLLRGLPPNKKIDRETIATLLQPEGMPDVDPQKRDAARQTVKAALELNLIEETEEKLIKLKFKSGDRRTTSQILLNALDATVLSDTKTEPFLAKFYSYLLFLNQDGVVKKSGDDWAVEFERDVYGDQRPPNPFNATKLAGLHRWMSYAGLGWYDTNDLFQPNPYERLQRRLPLIFQGRAKKLSSEEFMSRLAAECPELDGGEIFKQTNAQYSADVKVCTLGLSHALIDLHLDDHIKLFCPPDSRGWSIEIAEPPSDGLQSGRIASVELVKTL
jgi:hypothetical protein